MGARMARPGKNLRVKHFITNKKGAIDENVRHAPGQLQAFREGSHIGDGIGIGITTHLNTSLLLIGRASVFEDEACVQGRPGGWHSSS